MRLPFWSSKRSKNRERILLLQNLLIIKEGIATFDELAESLGFKKDIDGLKKFLLEIPLESLYNYKLTDEGLEVVYKTDFNKRTYSIQLARKSIDWLKTKKGWNRNFFFICQIFVLVLSAATTLAIGFDWLSRDFELLFSVGVTFFSAALIAFHFRDNWIRYSGAINRFENELYNFQLGEGNYKDTKNAVGEFLKKMQQINTEEVEEWRKMMTKISLEDEIKTSIRLMKEIQKEFKEPTDEEEDEG
ncbi:MAG: DUF4231 domain-containing protein [Candidatus Hodarchaeales archaeon]|jgi:hypothetical protein